MPIVDVDSRHPQRIVVHTNFNEKELIKRIPGSKYHGDDKFWSVPLTWVACLQLRGIFRDTLQLGDGLRRWAISERARIDELTMLRDHIEPTDRVMPKLYPFQEAGVDWLDAAKFALLGDEMGTGKTIQALRWIHEHKHLPALVICPNSTVFNWEEEAQKWLPEATPYVIKGGQVQRRKLLAQAKADHTALVIINIEGVRGHSRLAPYGSVHLKRCATCDPKLGDPKLTATRCEVHPKELNEFGFRTVIFDEAHRIKDPRSQQTRAAWAVAHDPSVMRRLAMTGTPMANDPSDLWSIVHFLDPKSHPTKSKFVDRYCLMSFNSWGGLTVVGVNPEVRTEFDNVLNPTFRRMTKDLVKLQLPPKVRSIVSVEMSAKQAKAYNDIADKLVTRLDDGQLLIAPTNLVGQTRLLQLAASYCKIGADGSVELCEPSPKIDALEDIIAEAGGKPLVVAAESRRLIELASARLTKSGVKHGLITGAVDEWDRKRALKDLDEGRIPVLMFTVKAGGTGLNMTAADTIVFLQRSFSMVDNRQAEDRVHRIGSDKHETIQIIDIITRETVDVTVIERYMEKLLRLDEITRDRERLRAAGLSTTDLDELEQLIMNANLGVPA